MRKNPFGSLAALILLSVFYLNVSAQEPINFTFGQVLQEEQKLMVTIRLEIAEGKAVRTSHQYGFTLFPQTVITVLSPMLILGARTTIIYQDQNIPAIQAYSNPRLGLAVLVLIKPLPIEVHKSNLFSGDNFSENTFILTAQSIIDASNLAEKDAEEDHLKGALAVDDYGVLLGIVLKIEKNDLGKLTPLMVPFGTVEIFIEILKLGPPIPRFDHQEDSRPKEAPIKSADIGTI